MVPTVPKVPLATKKVVPPISPSSSHDTAGQLGLHVTPAVTRISFTADVSASPLIPPVPPANNGLTTGRYDRSTRRDGLSCREVVHVHVTDVVGPSGQRTCNSNVADGVAPGRQRPRQSYVPTHEPWRTPRCPLVRRYGPFPLVGPAVATPNQPTTTDPTRKPTPATDRTNGDFRSILICPSLGCVWLKAKRARLTRRVSAQEVCIQANAATPKA